MAPRKLTNNVKTQQWAATTGPQKFELIAWRITIICASGKGMDINGAKIAVPAGAAPLVIQLGGAFDTFGNPIPTKLSGLYLGAALVFLEQLDPDIR